MNLSLLSGLEEVLFLAVLNTAPMSILVCGFGVCMARIWCICGMRVCVLLGMCREGHQGPGSLVLIEQAQHLKTRGKKSASFCYGKMTVVSQEL